MKTEQSALTGESSRQSIHKCFCGAEFAKNVGWYGRSKFCAVCNTVYTPLYDATIYNEKYRDKYISYRDSPENEPLQQIRWNLVGKYLMKGKVLDVGCGVGAFIQAAPKRYKVYGQDINPACVEYCKNQGMTAYNAYTSFWKAFDVVTMWDVIEHFDALDLLIAVCDTLKVGGYLILATPNFDTKYVDNLEQWRHYRPYEHVWNFSEDSIRMIAEKNNLEFVESNFEESEVRKPEKNILTCVLRKP